MAGKKFVTSKVNLRRQKEQVIEEMHRKLAGGGAAAQLSHVKTQSRRRLHLVLCYCVCAVIIAAATVISIVQWGRQTTAVAKVESRITKPVELMDRELATQKISTDTYARLLCDLLVNFEQVPEKYREGIPRIHTPEIYARLDSIQQQISQDTRNHIALLLPRMRGPQLDLNGIPISDSGPRR